MPLTWLPAVLMRKIVCLVRKTIDLVIKIKLVALGRMNYQKIPNGIIHRISKKEQFSAKMRIIKPLKTMDPQKAF